MSFNDPAFVDEFRLLVARLGVQRILEVGCKSGELAQVVGADGIDVAPQLDWVAKADIRDYFVSASCARA